MKRTSIFQFSFLTLWFIFLASMSSTTYAQIKNPVKWQSEIKHIENDEFDIIFRARVQTGWAVYSQYLPSDDGPIPTEIYYESEDGFSLKGKATESGDKIEGYDPIFEMDVIKFKNTYTITQRISVSDYETKITGYLTFMTCDDEQCLPPTDYDFEFSPQKSKKQDQPSSQEDGQGAAPADASEPSGLVIDDVKISGDDTIDEDVSEENLFGNILSSEDGILKPVKWKGEINRIDDLTFDLIFTAKIDKGWNIYSNTLEDDDGPVPTDFFFDDEDILVEQPKFKEEGDHIEKSFDPFFDMELIKVKEEATYTARIQLREDRKAFMGFIDYMVCDDTRCLPPTPINFSIDLTANEVHIDGQEDDDDSLAAGKTRGEGTPVFAEFNYDLADKDCEGTDSPDDDKQSYFWIFILGFGGGLLAILTPCVFPMIPLTISYFTKSSSTKAAGVKNAIIYGISIIVIYLVLGLLITGIFGADALNLLSTNAWFNIFFAILFIVFAISFFGYFEITLPASWVNQADKASDRGGLIGTFFMAFTLSLVSFSCTGPIIGTLLVETATGGGATILGRIPVAPLIGMFGFALALALPFALFAAFPGWLASMPRSGGWMNSIKVTLGFVEIALALKFLSIADLTMGWKILPYELFVVLWILCALGLAAYYLGLIKFPHDSPVKDISNLRKGMAFAMIALAVYFATGLRYSEKAGTFDTPNLLSGLAPPAGHSFIYPNTCPLNLNCYKDYEEGLEVARRQNKPVLIDFTGHGCVNCRRMEDQIWSQDPIYNLLKDEYIIISLYVDERKALDEPYVSKFSGRQMRTVGNKWADFQAIHFNRNSQPYYVLSTSEGRILNRPVAYLPDAVEYEAFLRCGLNTFRKN